MGGTLILPLAAETDEKDTRRKKEKDARHKCFTITGGGLPIKMTGLKEISHAREIKQQTGKRRRRGQERMGEAAATLQTWTV